MKKDIWIFQNGRIVIEKSVYYAKSADFVHQFDKLFQGESSSKTDASNDR